MKKNAFTLMELLAVIVILAILAIVVAPLIINQLARKKTEINDATKALLAESALSYVDANVDLYPKIDSRTYCFSLQKVADNGYLTDPFIDPTTSSALELDQIAVLLEYQNNQFEVTVDASCIVQN